MDEISRKKPRDQQSSKGLDIALLFLEHSVLKEAVDPKLSWGLPSTATRVSKR
jgi:hypothetical protein